MVTRLDRMAAILTVMGRLLLVAVLLSLSLLVEDRFPVLRSVTGILKAPLGLNTYNAPVVAGLLMLAYFVVVSVRSKVRRRAADHSMVTIVESRRSYLRFADLTIVKNAPIPYLRQVEVEIDRIGNSPRLDTVGLLNTIISGGLSVGASDIHIAPERDVVRVVLRVDGVLHDIGAITPENAQYLINRIKVLARLSLDVRAKPQDGAITFDRTDYHLRVSTLPTSHGEKVVIRLAVIDDTRYQIDKLGFGSEILPVFKSLLIRDHGVIYLTGPTGSGKTTTMYSSMMYIRSVRGEVVNMVTLEDPVEVDFPGISQTQVNTAAGLTFASGLRSILRQDPDVILVGEIRDEETAQVAIRAGLSGHLLLTSVHADSSVGVFNRLVHLHVERLQLASGSLAVVNQRLALRNCRECAAEVTLRSYQEQQLRLLGVPPEGPFFEGRGCPACGGSGKLGRVSLFELLVVTDRFRDLFIDEAPAHKLRQLAVQEGMIPLERQALERAKEGTISIDEVIRVLTSGTALALKGSATRGKGKTRRTS